MTKQDVLSKIGNIICYRVKSVKDKITEANLIEDLNNRIKIAGQEVTLFETLEQDVADMVCETLVVNTFTLIKDDVAKIIAMSRGL